MMVKIAETTEVFDHAAYREKELGGGKLNITNTVCLSSVSAAAQLNARCILAPTLSGYTCRMLSKGVRMSILSVLLRMTVYFARCRFSGVCVR